MNFSLLILKFFVFILINFFLIFQLFFSLNFFFSTIIDEELIICFAIFFVFILFINQIVSGLQEMLRSRIEIYLNVFLLVFKLLRKCLKRFKKHNSKALNSRTYLFAFLFQTFLKNLSSIFFYQNVLITYMIHLRLKIVNDIIISNLEIQNSLKKRFISEAYETEVKYLSLSKFLKKS